MAERITEANAAESAHLFGYNRGRLRWSRGAKAESRKLPMSTASKKAIGWAKEKPGRLAGLNEQATRWICEDAMKFTAHAEERAASRLRPSFSQIPQIPPRTECKSGIFEHLPLKSWISAES